MNQRHLSLRQLVSLVYHLDADFAQPCILVIVVFEVLMRLVARQYESNGVAVCTTLRLNVVEEDDELGIETALTLHSALLLEFLLNGLAYLTLNMLNRIVNILIGVQSSAVDYGAIHIEATYVVGLVVEAKVGVLRNFLLDVDGITQVIHLEYGEAALAAVLDVLLDEEVLIFQESLLTRILVRFVIATKTLRKQQVELHAIILVVVFAQLEAFDFFLLIECRQVKAEQLQVRWTVDADT